MSRVLIVEDDPAILRGLADNLRFESHEVLTASDGETGYRLARERRRISAGDVVRVVAQIESNEEQGIAPASQLGEKVVRPLVEKFHGKLMAELDRISIEDLCEEAERQGLGLKDKTKMDFTI